MLGYKLNRHCTTQLHHNICFHALNSTHNVLLPSSKITQLLQRVFQTENQRHITLNSNHRSTVNHEDSLCIRRSLLYAMADPRPTRQQATSSTVSWNTDDAYEYIVQVLGHAEKIPQRYDYTLGTQEMLRRLRARYGPEHGMRCVGLLRWHLGLAEDDEVVDETIWRNWRSYFARHRVGAMVPLGAYYRMC